jgi:amino acid permease
VVVTSSAKLSGLPKYSDWLPPHTGSLQITPSSVQGLFKTLPLLCFSFLCHQNAFPIYNKLPLATRTVNNMTIISSISMGACLTAYLAIGK